MDKKKIKLEKQNAVHSYLICPVSVRFVVLYFSKKTDMVNLKTVSINLLFLLLAPKCHCSAEFDILNHSYCFLFVSFDFVTVATQNNTFNKEMHL